MSIYVNRTLNLKKIQAIGFDMDYTIVRYDTQRFETLTFDNVKNKLVTELNYPQQVNHIKFDFNRAIRGLIIDEKHGNLIKISLYGRIKQAYHGTREIDFKDMNKLYRGQVIDLKEPNYFPVDTAFSISHAVLYAELVDLKDKNPDQYPSYEEMAKDVLHMIDLAHRDDSLKSDVLANLDDYIIQDEKIVHALERFKRNGKKLFVVTNSDYKYTQKLLDYAFTPHLQDHKDWRELFEIVVTFASKPRFFIGGQRYLKLDEQTQQLENLEGSLEPGIYQGGDFEKLQEYFKLQGDEILYIGDHIYGDVVALKKLCQWRTGLILEEIEEEVKSLQKGKSAIEEIEKLMIDKEKIEDHIDFLYENNKDRKEIDKAFTDLKTLDSNLEKYLTKYNSHFNPYWGEVMRSGAEESRFAGQVAKYACIYMSKVSDFHGHSPRKYFRPLKRSMPHDL